MATSSNPTEVIRQKMRSRAKTDLFYLTRDILGYKELTESFHKGVCDIVQSREHRSRLFLLPRGHFKTTIITVAHSIQLLLNNPDERILIASCTLKNAQEMLGIIKNHFFGKTNISAKLKISIFKWLFPEFCPTTEEWGTQDRVVLPNRKNWTLKEGSIEVMGSEGKVTGRHYTYLKKDDLVTPETVTTKEQIEKTIQWDQYSVSLFDSPGRDRCDYVGTRYDYSDLYGYLIEQGAVHVYQRSAVEAGVPIFPERFSLETLEAIRKSQGSYIYSCQYMNSPVDEQTAVFRKSWIKRWDSLAKDLRFTMTVDPATDTGEDFAAIIVLGCDKHNNWFIVHASRYKCTEGELIRHIVEVFLRWKPVRVGFEVNGFQRVIKRALVEECTKRGIRIPVLELTTLRFKSKEERIRGLAPFFENGTIFIGPGMEDLEDELLRFPRNRRRDLVDCLSMQMTVATRRVYDETAEASGKLPEHPPDLQASITGYY